MSNGFAELTDEMRTAADVLQKCSRLFGSRQPDTMAWTARRLRYEADVLDRPLTEETP